MLAQRRWRGRRAPSAAAVQATARGKADNGLIGQLPPWPGGELIPQKIECDRGNSEEFIRNLNAMGQDSPGITATRKQAEELGTPCRFTA
jgi:hypothetical protein